MSFYIKYDYIRITFLYLHIRSGNVVMIFHNSFGRFCIKIIYWHYKLILKFTNNFYFEMIAKHLGMLSFDHLISVHGREIMIGKYNHCEGLSRVKNESIWLRQYVITHENKQINWSKRPYFPFICHMIRQSKLELK